MDGFLNQNVVQFKKLLKSERRVRHMVSLPMGECDMQKLSQHAEQLVVLTELLRGFAEETESLVGKAAFMIMMSHVKVPVSILRQREAQRRDC